MGVAAGEEGWGGGGDGGWGGLAVEVELVYVALVHHDLRRARRRRRRRHRSSVAADTTRLRRHTLKRRQQLLLLLLLLLPPAAAAAAFPRRPVLPRFHRLTLPFNPFPPLAPALLPLHAPQTRSNCATLMNRP